ITPVLALAKTIHGKNLKNQISQNYAYNEGQTVQSFFFSSRRRHTRFSRDWSSDVCSSDLHAAGLAAPMDPGPDRRHPLVHAWRKIGRASCRERVDVQCVNISLI